MRAYGEYLDFAAWLARAKLGVDIDPEDPPTHELARMTKAAGIRAEEAMDDYIDTIKSQAATF